MNSKKALGEKCPVCWKIRTGKCSREFCGLLKMLKFFKKSFYVNFFIVVSIFVLDRVSKLYVINSYDNNLGNDLFTSKYLNIILIWNDGIAFVFFLIIIKYFTI